MRQQHHDEEEGVSAGGDGVAGPLGANDDDVERVVRVDAGVGGAVEGTTEGGPEEDTGGDDVEGVANGFADGVVDVGVVGVANVDIVGVAGGGAVLFAAGTGNEVGADVTVGGRPERARGASSSSRHGAGQSSTNWLDKGRRRFGGNMKFLLPLGA
ncbi:hypothetical protein GUJ93_ZPchr0013g37852 [Zizania palustris]|uniref:Uncharacterized protein n=1 Tax=Zizania palustris TaxID=103762 RepID=A0A8J5WW67_ZIZPA|nr:hypothetical protein GUJ93_ZPchr0013g37852 [Zizania palustris]